MMARSQVITAGMSGQVIGIDLAAVKAVMDVCGVTDQKDCLQKVVSTFHHFLAAREED